MPCGCLPPGSPSAKRRAVALPRPCRQLWHGSPACLVSGLRVVVVECGIRRMRVRLCGWTGRPSPPPSKRGSVWASGDRAWEVGVQEIDAVWSAHAGVPTRHEGWCLGSRACSAFLHGTACRHGEGTRTWEISGTRSACAGAKSAKALLQHSACCWACWSNAGEAIGHPDGGRACMCVPMDLHEHAIRLSRKIADRCLIDRMRMAMPPLLLPGSLHCIPCCSCAVMSVCPCVSAFSGLPA